MSEKKVGGINAPLIVLGIILMLIGLVLLGLAFETMASYIYGDTMLGSVRFFFSDANKALGFCLSAFIVFVIGLIITEKQIVEHQKSNSARSHKRLEAEREKEEGVV